MTNVPQPILGPTGYVAPAQSAILAGVQADYNIAFTVTFNFGTTTNPTPQGQLTASTAAIVGNSYDQFCLLLQQFDPAYASGRYQDGLGRLYNMTRNPAIPTTLLVTCQGLTGTQIPVTATILDPSGNIYTAAGSGAIGVNGTVGIYFANNNAGVIAVPESISIYQAIPGWDSVTLVSGVLGENVETRYQFEARRQTTIAALSIGSLPSVQGALLELSGVTSAYVTENTNPTPTTIGGVVLAANSIFVCVNGGSPSQIAQAIWSKKAPGCNYNGNTTVTVQDTSPGYVPPYPSYQVTYETAIGLPVYVNVNIVNSQQVPSNGVQLIQNAIINAWGGGDGGPAVQIGGEVFASRYYAPVGSVGSWAQIRSITVGSDDTPAAVFTGNLVGTTLNVTSLTNGALSVGDYITGSTGGGTGIVVGTLITGLGSGTGGTGSYTVNISQTVPSSPLIQAISPTSNQVVPNINQIPTIAAPNINVTFT
jgi:hypothetical protein